ncbi:MAG: hypothetical protein OXU20_30445 [Myxococcales bacterium]|nr:hypothetical protein [Myxococcales bacterium]
MHAGLLIDSIVRQTTVLIASLATASGHRTQLAHVANHVFADLVRELRDQGLGNKVIADMFGMALRTYRRRLARLSSSRTEQGKSLWQAVLAHIQAHGPVTRASVLLRFAHDDESVVRSILQDLVRSGLVACSGIDETALFDASAVLRGEHAPPEDALESLLLVALHQVGPVDLEALQELVPAPAEALEQALGRLVDDGLVALERRGRHARYHCESYLIDFGDAVGWEAAVFDHYQAMVASIVSKLRQGQCSAHLQDQIGGSTFAFDLWEGHPMEARIRGYLRSMREQGMALRRELEEDIQARPMPSDAAPLRVLAYVGQTVVGADEPEHNESGEEEG